MTIAGGMMGALYHRERTGEATVVDVSLLGVGMWAMGQAIALSLLTDTPWTAPPMDRMRANPLAANYETKDGRVLAFTCLQAAKYWPGICDVIGRPELATDERFADHASLMANSVDAGGILRDAFAERTLVEWREALADFRGQWTVVQDTLEAVANGYVQPCETANGTPFRLVAAPVQFDEEAAAPGRAPEFNEHGDAILADLGIDWDTIVDLKVRGVVA
jgi:crotonobetainyl-CoA:carnitine CoA-transferase CaiB-like acyl-CoA transferase